MHLKLLRSLKGDKYQDRTSESVLTSPECARVCGSSTSKSPRSGDADSPGPCRCRLTYFSPRSWRCCPTSRITSSSPGDKRFFFEPPSETPLPLLQAGCWLLLTLTTVLPLLLTLSPLVCAVAAEDGSPFWRRDSSASGSCGAPFACMLPQMTLRSRPTAGSKLKPRLCAALRDNSADPAADRPADPDAALERPLRRPAALRVRFAARSLAFRRANLTGRPHPEQSPSAAAEVAAPACCCCSDSCNLVTDIRGDVSGNSDALCVSCCANTRIRTVRSNCALPKANI